MTGVGRALTAAVLLLLLACGSSGTEITDRTVEVGCAMCQFEMEGANSCYWAVRFDDTTVPMRGEGIPDDHDAHGPDGMCNVTHEAVVSGTLYETYFLVTQMELGEIRPGTSSHDHAH